MTPIEQILNGLFETYAERVPDVNKIRKAMVHNGMIDSVDSIENDHIAFRTMGVQHLGIESFEKIFLHHGYEKRDYYKFEKKKLNAYWYSPSNPKLPRIFLSELIVKDVSQKVQNIIHKYTSTVHSDPVDDLDLDDADAVLQFLHAPLWETPTRKEYEDLLQESEYAAWVIYNRYYLNHFTISVHTLPDPYNQLEKFDDFLIDLGIKLNDSGGIIKTSADGLLRQSSTVAELVEAQFAGGQSKLIAGSYVEFAERSALPQFANIPRAELTRAMLRDGFEASNADKIFESTFTKQTMK